MAKRLVKCLYCGQTFDAEDKSIEWVKPRSNRYAHKECHEHPERFMSKDELDQANFYNYCKKVFGDKFDFVKTKRLAESYIKKYDYSWSGMTKALVYFYEVKKNKLADDASVAIIPYIYNDAYNYYYDIWQTQQLNIDKKIEDYVPEDMVITIPPPRAKRRKKKLFSFLDKEAD